TVRDTQLLLQGHVVPTTKYTWYVKATNTDWSGPYFFTTSNFTPAGGGSYGNVYIENQTGDTILEVVTSNLATGDTWCIAVEGSDLGTVLTVTNPDSNAKRFMLQEADTTELKGDLTQFQSSVIELKLYDKSGNDISANPSVGRTLTIDYSGLTIADPSKLAVFWYDPVAKKWRDVVSVAGMIINWPDGSSGYRRDTVKKTVSIRVSHFSIFGLFTTSDEKAGQTAGNTAVTSKKEIKVYPNPFSPNDGNPTTGTQYTTGADGEGIYFHVNDAEGVEIEIYTAKGALVRTLSKQGTDNYLRWNTKNEHGTKVSSGVYIAVIKQSVLGTVVRKFVIIR
ncbi:MAG: T9SS type A sorting domain-containing protein, partial [Candidatus Lindowbacteria bacterium]|nr:T9SS type A sorting domain-containing protein [Candidatus Lindowbacteria bacterium]